MPNYDPYKLLRDMKVQQDQNEKTLLLLRKRLVHPDRYFQKFQKFFYGFILIVYHQFHMII
jgi:hypothetical protein